MTQHARETRLAEYNTAATPNRTETTHRKVNNISLAVLPCPNWSENGMRYLEMSTGKIWNFETL